MNSKVKAFVIFIVGLVFGSAVTFTVIGKITQRQFAVQYSTDVIEQAVFAIELRANRHEETGKRIETRLPSYVLAISSK